MSVSIIVGGQYGSEGKGKTAYYWAKKMGAAAVVRVGGSNSGHTVYDIDGTRCALRMLPTASITKEIVSVLPAGAYIDIPVLMKEIEELGVTKEFLKIDPNAMVITEEYKEEEGKRNLRTEIGSTLSGTGIAVMERVGRSKRVLLARDMPQLAPFLADTKIYMRTLLENGEHIVIEGTQGYGLSNYHAKDYPFATGRDTTAAGFLAETGLSPFDIEHIVMVIRAFPIRVAGNSGPMEQEINWQQVTEEAGAGELLEEKTTVTQCVRRVARFTPGIVREAILVNKPDVIVMNHMDYIDYSNKNRDTLSEKQMVFLKEVEEKIGCNISYCGNGEMNIFAVEGICS